MRILLSSVLFAPSVGGIETVSRLLAEEFSRLGNEVTVVTQTPSPAHDRSPYRVLRDPGWRELLRCVAAAEVVFHSNVSLRFAWPLVAVGGRPWVIAHHVWTPRSGPGGRTGRIKHAAFPWARNIAVSGAVARSLAVPARVIPNPYDERRFACLPGARTERDLVFLGRLVSDKGAVVLLEALARLRRRGCTPTLTVIGSGPEEAALRAFAARAGIAGQTEFAGTLQNETLVERLNAHRLLVVPSTWEEPFGVVALEGIACGLVPIVTRSGGLPEAVGPCGVVVPKNDATALADAIERLLGDASGRERLIAGAGPHLAKHRPAPVAAAYLEELARAVERLPAHEADA